MAGGPDGLRPRGDPCEEHEPALLARSPRLRKPRSAAGTPRKRFGAITGTLAHPQLLSLGRDDATGRLRPRRPHRPTVPPRGPGARRTPRRGGPRPIPGPARRFPSAWGTRDVLEPSSSGPRRGDWTRPSRTCPGSAGPGRSRGVSEDQGPRWDAALGSETALPPGGDGVVTCALFRRMGRGARRSSQLLRWVSGGGLSNPVHAPSVAGLRRGGAQAVQEATRAALARRAVPGEVGVAEPQV